MAVVRDLTPQFLAGFGDRVERILDQTAIKGVRHMKAAMREPKTGAPAPGVERRLRRPREKDWITTRSAPGEAPAVQRGTLIDSLGWQRAGKFVRRVGSSFAIKKFGISTGNYALALEFGTRKMQPRPYLRPAFLHMKGELKRRLPGMF